MAHKSKTQRAKASAARSARKEARELESPVEAAVEKTEESSEKTKTGIFKKKEAAESAKASASAPEKKQKDKKPKKERWKFFKAVRAEMKRVTWPTKQDVLRWSVVVVAALLFFGIYVALLDNAVVTPILVAISSLGA